jgi:hypothetical protein
MKKESSKRRIQDWRATANMVLVVTTVTTSGVCYYTILWKGVTGVFQDLAAGQWCGLYMWSLFAFLVARTWKTSVASSICLLARSLFLCNKIYSWRYRVYYAAINCMPHYPPYGKRFDSSPCLIPGIRQGAESNPLGCCWLKFPYELPLGMCRLNRILVQSPLCCSMNCLQSTDISPPIAPPFPIRG